MPKERSGAMRPCRLDDENRTLTDLPRFENDLKEQIYEQSQRAHSSSFLMFNVP
jgi:hypothetical protein